MLVPIEASHSLQAVKVHKNPQVAPDLQSHCQATLARHCRALSSVPDHLLLSSDLGDTR